MLPEVPQLQQQLLLLKQQQRQLQQHQHLLLQLLRQESLDDDIDVRKRSPEEAKEQQHLQLQQQQVHLQRLQQQELLQQQLQLLWCQQQRIEQRLQQHREFQGLAQGQQCQWGTSASQPSTVGTPVAAAVTPPQAQHHPVVPAVSNGSELPGAAVPIAGASAGAASTGPVETPEAGMVLQEESGDDSDWGDGDIEPVCVLPLRGSAVAAAAAAAAEGPAAAAAAAAGIPAALYEDAGAALNSPLLSPREYAEGPPSLPSPSEQISLDEQEEDTVADTAVALDGVAGCRTQQQEPPQQHQQQQKQQHQQERHSLSSFSSKGVRPTGAGRVGSSAGRTNSQRVAGGAPAAAPGASSAAEAIPGSPTAATTPAAAEASAADAVMQQQQQFNKHKEGRQGTHRGQQRTARGLSQRQHHLHHHPQQQQNQEALGFRRQQAGSEQQQLQSQPQTHTAYSGTRGARHRLPPRGCRSLGMETGHASRSPAGSFSSGGLWGPVSVGAPSQLSQLRMQDSPWWAQCQVPLTTAPRKSSAATGGDTEASRQASCSDGSSSKRSSRSSNSNGNSSRSSTDSPNRRAASGAQLSPGDSQPAAFARTPTETLEAGRQAGQRDGPSADPAAEAAAIPSGMTDKRNHGVALAACTSSPVASITRAAALHSESGSSSSRVQTSGSNQTDTSYHNSAAQSCQRQLDAQRPAAPRAIQQQPDVTGPVQLPLSTGEDGQQQQKQDEEQQPTAQYPDVFLQRQQHQALLRRPGAVGSPHISLPLRQRQQQKVLGLLAQGAQPPFAGGGQETEGEALPSAALTAATAAAADQLPHMVSASQLQQLALPAAAAAAAAAVAETCRKLDALAASAERGPREAAATATAAAVAVPPFTVSEPFPDSPQNVSLLLQQQATALVRMQQQHMLLQQALVEHQRANRTAQLQIPQPGGYITEQAGRDSFAAAGEAAGHGASIPMSEGPPIGELESVTVQWQSQLQQVQVPAESPQQARRDRVVMPRQLVALQQLLAQHLATYQRLHEEQQQHKGFGPPDPLRKTASMPKGLQQRIDSSCCEDGHLVCMSSDGVYHKEGGDMGQSDSYSIRNIPPLPVPLLPHSHEQ